MLDFYLCKEIIGILNICLRWSGREKSAVAGPVHHVKRTSMSLMSTPARHANWGPGPLMTLQVRVSQCQHRYSSLLLNKIKNKSNWRRHIHGKRESCQPAFFILVALVYVTKNFLQNRSLPNIWLIVKIYRSYRGIGL